MIWVPRLALGLMLFTALLLMAFPAVARINISEPTKITDWVLIVVTVSYVIVSGLQWWALHKQNAVARQNTALAKSALVIGQRAYLDIAEWQMTEDSQILFEIWNSGRTPGYVTQILAGIVIGDALPEQPGGHELPADNMVVVHPHSKPKIPLRFRPTGRQWDDITHDRQGLFVWARIAYLDVFNDPHVTGCAMRFDGVASFSFLNVPNYTIST